MAIASRLGGPLGRFGTPALYNVAFSNALNEVANGAPLNLQQDVGAAAQGAAIPALFGLGEFGYGFAKSNIYNPYLRELLTGVKYAGEVPTSDDSGYLAKGRITLPRQPVRGYYTLPPDIDPAILASLTPDEIEAIRLSGGFNKLPLTKSYFRDWAPGISPEAKQVEFALAAGNRNPNLPNLTYQQLLQQQAESGELSKGISFHLMPSTQANKELLDAMAFQVDPRFAGGANKAYAVYSFVDADGKDYYLMVDQGSGTKLGRGRGYYGSQPIAVFDEDGQLVNLNTAYNYAGYGSPENTPRPVEGTKTGQAYGTMTLTSRYMPYVQENPVLSLEEFIKDTGITPSQPHFFDAYESYAKGEGKLSYPRENSLYRQFGGYGENQLQGEPGQVMTKEPGTSTSVMFRAPERGMFSGIPIAEKVLAPYNELFLDFRNPEASLLSQTGIKTAAAYQRYPPTALIEDTNGKGTLVVRERIGYEMDAKGNPIKTKPIYSKQWSFPGGGVDDPYIDPKEGLDEELSQELGITVKSSNYQGTQPGSVFERHGDNAPTQNQFYVYKTTITGEPTISSQEIGEIGYYKPGEGKVLTPDAQKLYDKYITGRPASTVISGERAPSIPSAPAIQAPIYTPEESPAFSTSPSSISSIPIPAYGSVPYPYRYSSPSSSGFANTSTGYSPFGSSVSPASLLSPSYTSSLLSRSASPVSSSGTPSVSPSYLSSPSYITSPSLIPSTISSYVSSPTYSGSSGSPYIPNPLPTKKPIPITPPFRQVPPLKLPPTTEPALTYQTQYAPSLTTTLLPQLTPNVTNPDTAILGVGLRGAYQAPGWTTPPRESPPHLIPPYSKPFRTPN